MSWAHRASTPRSSSSGNGINGINVMNGTNSLTPPNTPASPKGQSAASSAAKERITNGGHIAPSPSITVKVDEPLKIVTRAPAISTLSDQAIKNLYFGPLIYISILQTDGRTERLDIPKISINLACANSRVIEAAVAKAVSHREHVGEIILPAGPIEAYKALFTWMDEITIDPQNKYFPVYKHTPAFMYWHCIDIAQKLALTGIIDRLQYRLKLFSVYHEVSKGGKGFLVVPEDIERAYRDLGKHHILTKTLVMNTALAWNDEAIFSKKYAALTDLTYHIPEFWDDLKPLIDPEKREGSVGAWHREKY